jgi:hypothetical protein
MNKSILFVLILCCGSLYGDGWKASITSVDSINHIKVADSLRTAKIINGTNAIAVCTDSTILTPEGGVAVLMKNLGDSTEYLGNPVIGTYASGISSGFKYFPYTANFNSGELFVGVVYSASIAPNAWGYVVVSGRAKIAIAYGNISTPTNGWLLTPVTQRKCTVASVALGPYSYLGSMISWQNLGQNARGDTLTMGIIHPFTTPESP